MTNNITSTRDTLLKDTDTLKRDAGQVVDDVKKHATSHVDAVKDNVNETFDSAYDYLRDHPLQLAGTALLVGFVLGSFRRR